MSNWGEKSENNILASTILIDNQLANQSVHCSYYSCVQYVFHIFNYHFGMDTEEVESQSHSSVNNVGTHKWIRKEIRTSIKQKNKIEAQRFYDDMGELYNARAIADYHHDNIEVEEAKNIKKLAIATVVFLKKHYEL